MSIIALSLLIFAGANPEVAASNNECSESTAEIASESSGTFEPQSQNGQTFLSIFLQIVKIYLIVMFCTYHIAFVCIALYFLVNRILQIIEDQREPEERACQQESNSNPNSESE